MPLSCLPVSLYGDLASGELTPGGWARLAASLGLDGADLSVAHLQPHPAWLRSVRREAEDAGLPIVMIATYTDFTHPDAGHRRRQVEELRRWIAAAAELGAPLARVTAGQAHPGIVEADALSWAADGLMACVDEGRAAGVTLLYENHTRGAVWTHDDFTLPARRFLDVVARTEGSGLRVLFDTANPLVLHDDPADMLRRVLPRVGAVHVSDIRRTGAFEPVLIGTGAAPIRQLLGMVVDHGFAGWFSIEEASRTGIEGFRRAIAFAQSMLTPTPQSHIPPRP